MVAFSCRSTAVEDWCNGVAQSTEAAENAWPARVRRLQWHHWRACLSQEDAPAPEIHRTVCYLEYKNDIIVNLTFPY